MITHKSSNRKHATKLVICLILLTISADGLPVRSVAQDGDKKRTLSRIEAEMAETRRKMAEMGSLVRANWERTDKARRDMTKKIGLEAMGMARGRSIVIDTALEGLEASEQFKDSADNAMSLQLALENPDPVLAILGTIEALFRVTIQAWGNFGKGTGKAAELGLGLGDFSTAWVPDVIDAFWTKDKATTRYGQLKQKYEELSTEALEKRTEKGLEETDRSEITARIDQYEKNMKTRNDKVDQYAATMEARKQFLPKCSEIEFKMPNSGAQVYRSTYVDRFGSPQSECYEGNALRMEWWCLRSDGSEGCFHSILYDYKGHVDGTWWVHENDSDTTYDCSCGK